MKTEANTADQKQAKKSSRFTGLVLTLLGAMVLLNNLGKSRAHCE